MEYPVWWIPQLGGALPIAFICIVHVFVAHFAVGGGLFLVLSEHKGYRENSQAILAYTKHHTKFFLLVSMVFGAITGVGIWTIISLVSPGPTSTLIHVFGFAFATEWVFFLGEIVALLVYYYTFGTMRKKEHLRVGWIYFIFGWLSLFTINGIVTFMLTPGAWLETQNFWQGLFNPTFWPSLLFRSGLAFMLAGLFAFFTATGIKDEKAQDSMVRYASKWVAWPFLALLAGGFWYFSAMTPEQQEMVLRKTSEALPFGYVLLISSVLILLGSLFLGYVAPRKSRRLLTFVLLFLGLMNIGAFEWVREAARRPYVLYGHTYSSNVRVADVERVRKEGMLGTAKWIKHKNPTPEQLLEAGRELYAIQCLSCHSVGTGLLDILPRTKKYSVYGLEAQLTGQGRLLKHMPPFAGNALDKKALATYLVQGLHKKAPIKQAEHPQALTLQVPAFDAEAAEYVLLAWPTTGMHFFSDADRFFSLEPPGNTIQAQLILRDSAPEIVTEGVKITYAIEKKFADPTAQTHFWEYATEIFEKKIEKNTGLTGNGLRGEMKPDDTLGGYVVDMLPVYPYAENGGFNPYPTITLEARDEASGKLLTTTKLVAPASTEMGCKKCHGGPWSMPGKAPVTGLSEQTALDVRRVHDRIHSTTLATNELGTQSKACQQCHYSPKSTWEEKPQMLSLSASIHGFHAHYLSGQGAEACSSCHPSDPKGATRCYRGTHAAKDINCTHCHGYMEDMALGLLKKEHEAGKKSAAKLMAGLTPRSVSTLGEIEARGPWENEPDCASCHDFETKPDPSNVNAFNTWTADASELYSTRKDEMDAVACVACHGSAHALYPANNAYGQKVHNLQPLQYQGVAATIGQGANCTVCHVDEMDDSAHHPIPEEE